jgi:hydroxyacylglutathione hydrolase
MQIDAFVTPGLGDSSYLVSWGEDAAMVDPQRDVERFLAAARARGVRIRTVIETHVHNDYVSGAAEIRAATGADIWVPSGGSYAFDHDPVEDGTEIPLGDGTLVAMATPGHTFEHTTYVLRGPDGSAIAAFTGGSLMVGGAGRTDLLGADHTDVLTRLQFASLRRLWTLPDDVLVMPTHGQGSFCGAGSSDGERERTSTIRIERAANAAFAESDEATFVRDQLEDLPSYPAYYRAMAPINRAGPPVRGAVPIPPPLGVDDVAAAIEDGVSIVDMRPGIAFAAAHVPGSINVPLRSDSASYVGWLVPFGAPIVLVVEDDAALSEAATELWRIGWEALVGHLDGGVEAWEASGRPTSSYPVVDVDGLLAELERGEAGDVVDVRQDTEWRDGHLEASRHRFVGDLPATIGAERRRGRTTFVCASGYRASMAASLLDAAGGEVRLVAPDGVPKALETLRQSV